MNKRLIVSIVKFFSFMSILLIIFISTSCKKLTPNPKSYVSSITASSTAKSYPVSNLSDGTYKSWCEGKKDNGIGESITIKFKEEVPRFVGSDGEKYGPFKKGEKAKIPKENAELMIKNDLGEK